MSMGMGLHGIRDWLRTEYGWTANQCGVQYQCLPPAIAGQFYVAIDDAGEATGPEETDALTEILNLEIGVWRRPSGKPADRLGMLKLPQDLYLANIYTGNDLERMVVTPTGAAQNKGGLHKNYGFLNFINTLFKLPNDDLGAGFNKPLHFLGFSRFEPIKVPGNSSDEEVFFGRKLRFRGLDRPQKVRATIG